MVDSSKARIQGELGAWSINALLRMRAAVELEEEEEEEEEEELQHNVCNRRR